MKIQFTTLPALVLGIWLGWASAQVSACGSMIELPRIMYPPQVLMPTVADRMDDWNEDLHLTTDEFLYILLPNQAQVRFEEDSKNPALKRLSVNDTSQLNQLPPPLEQAGYQWWYLLASHPGVSILHIATGSQKKTLKVEVKAYQPRYEVPARSPNVVKAEAATQAHPYQISYGEQVAITLPGDIASGWSVNPLEESGLKLARIEAVRFYSDNKPDEVKLIFDVTGTRAPGKTSHLRIQNKTGFFSSSSFDFYFSILPAIAC